MKKIGYNQWFVNQQKENRLKSYKKVTLFRRYWDDPNKEYTWEKKVNINIDNDIIKCGKVTWKADTTQLNIWKMGNISLTVNNDHGKWDTNNSDGYFDGYEPFLSMIRIEVGFIASDGTQYEIFAYQGLISQDGIQLESNKNSAKLKIISLDYLLKSVDAERVSQSPIDPKFSSIANIHTSTTIGNSGLSWSVNIYQYIIVRIIAGTGVGQERLILSNTSNTLTVNTWDITPDATSYFEIIGEYKGEGNSATTLYTTIQPGVGRIKKVWKNYTEQYVSEQYNIDNLNKITLGADVNFVNPPVPGEHIVVDYIYWYQNETFKFVIEKILDLAGVSNRYVKDILFPERLGVGALVTWEQTSDVDWQAGISTQANLTDFVGDIAIDDDIVTTYKDYYAGSETETSIHRWATNIGGTYQHAQSFIAKKTAFISSIDVLLKFFGSPTGSIEMQLCNDDGGKPGTVIETSPTAPSMPPGGITSTRFEEWKTFLFGNNKLIAGTRYWIKWYRTGVEGGVVGILFEENPTPNSDKFFSISADSGATWDNVGRYVAYDGFANFRFHYHPHHVWGSHMSQTLDCGVSLTSYEKLYPISTLNGGTAVYYTKSSNVDSFPATWNASEWDQVDSFGNISSTVLRYIRVAVYFVPNYPGGVQSPNNIDTPNIHSYQLKYYTETYQSSLINFTDKNGKSAIEVTARLGNYEMGFFTDFNDSLNMVWDVEYDGTVMPQTVGWTENKSGNGSGSIVSNELVINGNFTSASAGSVVDAGWFVRNKVSFAELSGTLYMASGGVQKIWRYDGGTTWTEIGSLPATISTTVTSLIAFGGTLYAGVQASASGERGVYRYDGGTTWTHIGLTAALQVGAMIEFEGNLYAGDFSSVYRYDGGTTWTSIGNSTYTRSLILFNGSLYSGANQGKILRYDGGTTWTEIADFTNAYSIDSMSVYNNILYAAVNNELFRYRNGNTWEGTGKITNNRIGSLHVHSDILYIGSEQSSHLYSYNGTTLNYISSPVNSVWGMQSFNDKLYIGLGILPTAVEAYTTPGYCFYDIDSSGLDPVSGWTVEADIEKISSDDENFTIEISDGTFLTKVIITKLSYLKLVEYNKDDIAKTKKAIFPAGSRYTLKIARKGMQIKIYVNNEVVLISYANNVCVNGVKNVKFGQLLGVGVDYENIVNYLNFSNTIASFETFYLPKYYFQPKENIVDTELVLDQDVNYIKLYNYRNGWDRVYNHVKASYGIYSYYATPYTEGDDKPNSEETYGKKILSISGEDFLKSEDTNVAVGTAKNYYEFHKMPRRRFNLFCRYLLQLNLSDKIYVNCNNPFTLTNLPVKIVGIVLDIDNFTLDLDVEEII